MKEHYRKIIIEEVARVALEDPEYRVHLQHELGIRPGELSTVYKYLCGLLRKESIARKK